MRFTGPLGRRTLGSERHQYAIARPDKLGTDPMAYIVVLIKMDAAAELGRNPIISKHHIFSLEYGDDEQADAGRDCRIHLARLNSQARTTRTEGNINFPCSADHVQDWQPYPVDL